MLHCCKEYEGDIVSFYSSKFSIFGLFMDDNYLDHKGYSFRSNVIEKKNIFIAIVIRLVNT